MMVIRPRWQKVLTDLWGNVSRTVLVVASIAVGLLAIGIISTIYLVSSNDMRVGYAAVNPANIYIQTGLIDEDVITHVSHVEGVRQAEGVRAFSLRIFNNKQQWQNIDIKAYKNYDELSINKVRLLEGRWPKEDEIVLGSNRVSEINAKIGEPVLIELPSLKTRSLLLVGIAQDQTIGAYGNTGGFFGAAIQSFISQDTLDKLEQGSKDLYNGVFTVTEGKGNDLETIQRVADKINHDLKFDNISVSSVKTVNSLDHPNASLIDAISGILLVLGLLSVFLSGFLVTNTLQALLKQQTQQIGIMKSIGARQLQITGVYISLIIAFGILAFLIAMPLAYIGAFALLDFISGKMNFLLQGWRIEMPVVILQGALAIFMPLIAAWSPIWEGSKISVIEALNPSSHNRHKKKTGNSSGDKKGRWLLKLPKFALPVTIAVRNTFRQKGRLFLTLLTLSLGGAIFVATFNVRASLDQYISQIKQYFISDVSLTFKHPYREEEIARDLKSVPGIGYYEGWNGATARIIMQDGSLMDRVSLQGIPFETKIIKPVLSSGRWIQPGDTYQIVLSDAFQLHYPYIKIGDTLRLKINDKNTDWKVVGFYQLAGKMSGLLAYTNYDILAKVTDGYDQVSTFQINSVKSMSPADQDQLKSEIETVMDADKIMVANINTGSNSSSTSSGGLTTLTVFLLFMAILIAIVGSIGLAGTMSMNVMERTREIGILRSIGASDQTLMRMVLSEGLTIGLISYIICVFLSFPITQILGDSVILVIFGSGAVITYTPVGFIIWFFMVVILSSLASFIPARGAAQMTIREVLSYE